MNFSKVQKFYFLIYLYKSWEIFIYYNYLKKGTNYNVTFQHFTKV